MDDKRNSVLSPEEIAKIAERVSKAPKESLYYSMWIERGVWLITPGGGSDEVYAQFGNDKFDELEKWIGLGELWTRANEDIPRLITTIAAKDAELRELRAQVREWLCESCNTVYPGPPKPGVAGVICPNCGSLTGPRSSAELRRIQAENADLRRELAIKDALIGQPAPDVQTYSTSTWPPDPCAKGHDKCYAPKVLLSLPPRHPWICRRCGEEGEDISRGIDAEEYGRLRWAKTKAQGKDGKS